MSQKKQINWTDKQKEAISLRQKNILVSAAAGSGKTAVLVERIKGLLLSGEAELSQMLIVTFSNAAASEMKEKIVSALNKELEESGGEPDKQRFLRRQLSGIHRCNISTFHAFAMEVIRRYFHLIDAEPNFRICDEGQKTILQTEAMDEVFSQRFEEQDADFLEFLTQYGVGKNENDVKDMILKLHGFVQSLPQPFVWLEEQIEMLSCTLDEFARSPAFAQMYEDIGRSLELVAFYFQEVEHFLEDNGIGSLQDKVSKDIELVEAAQKALAIPEGSKQTRLDGFGRVCRYLRGEAGGFQRFVPSKEEKESYAPIKDTVAELRDKGKSIFKKLSEQYAAKSLEEYVEECNETAKYAKELFLLVLAFDEVYHQKKEKKSMLDFNDIEHDALAILAHEEAAGEYRRKFSYIFVDEYQDSNLVQETLIGRIKRENNVFMVGDVKQSIYKFRLAEPELFIEKYNRYRKSETGLDVKVDLNQNFRSKGEIIKAINYVFAQIMNQESTGMDYDEDAKLYEGVIYEGPFNYPVSLHLVDDGAVDGEGLDEEIRNMKKAELEAHAAARIIREAKGKPIYDTKKKCVRPLKNRDVVLLLRSAKGYGELYYKALNEEGIPAFMDQSDGYFDTVEIQVFLNLLQTIDNGKQDLPLLSVLRSPVFGFSIDELAEIRLAKQRGAYYEAFDFYKCHGEEEALRQKCLWAAESLIRWRRKAAYTPLSDFLSGLVHETGYGNFVAAVPGGLQRQANLRALIDKATEYQETQGKGLFGFIRYIDALKKEKISVGQVKLVGENDDVVRIMTVHKSKGLEFPFVLVGGLGKRFNFRQDTVKVSCHKELGVALRLVDAQKGYYKKTLLQTLIEQKKRREDMAEEIRTLYVAFTRAMDELVLLGTLTDVDQAMSRYELQNQRDVRSATCYLDLLVPLLKDAGALSQGEVQPIIYRHTREEYSGERVITQGVREALRRDLSQGFEVDGGEDLKELEAEVRRRLSFVYPVSQEKKKSKYSVSELANPKKQQQNEGFALMSAVPRFVEGKRKITAAERGTAIHKVMEHIPFRKEYQSAAEIRTFVAELARKEILSKEEAEAVDIEAIAAFFDSAIGQRACASPKLYREVSFNMKKEWEGETILVQGTIDCYFLEGEYAVLLDYKSNAVGEGNRQQAVQQLTDHYRPQLALYQEALQRIRGLAVLESYLYLFALGEEVRIG